jgi:3-phenylpropionate/cinnamic acid dioxygenase small subunit
MSSSPANDPPVAPSSTAAPATAVAIPTAGPDFEHLLAQDVVIEAGTSAPTGAQSIAPEHSPRAPQAGVVVAGAMLPAPALLAGTAALQSEVEQFLYRQAELLDGKHWQAWIDLFDAQGVYWMPVLPEQTEWEGSPSIFAEDKLMMEIRKGRVTHPNAWSQAPMWETNHLVSHVAIESLGHAAAGGLDAAIRVRSRFHMMELRRDQVRHFGGRYTHHLVRADDGGLRILLQRVDMFNAQAPFDYVLQIWV